MVFDFIVLVVASWALLRVAGRSSLVQLLFLDGLAYFAGQFVCSYFLFETHLVI